MKGSEKQITWAEEIRSNIINTMNAMIEMQKAAGAPENVIAANTAACAERINALNNAEYASTVIGIFGHIRFSGDAQKDMKSVLAAYRIGSQSVNEDDAAAILCRK